MSGFPQAIGAIDGCHIRIKAPLKNAEDYINRKDYHSIILQGLVDSRYLFRDIFVGWTGKTHDARVFKKFTFVSRMLTKNILTNEFVKKFTGKYGSTIAFGRLSLPSGRVYNEAIR